jgi:hypothetical protein
MEKIFRREMESKVDAGAVLLKLENAMMIV